MSIYANCLVLIHILFRSVLNDSYERRAIEDYLARGNTVSPVSGRPIRQSDLIPNGYPTASRNVP